MLSEVSENNSEYNPNEWIDFFDRKFTKKKKKKKKKNC